MDGGDPPGGAVVIWARRAVALTALLAVVALVGSAAGWLLSGLGALAGWVLRRALPVALILVIVAVVAGVMARRKG